MAEELTGIYAGNRHQGQLHSIPTSIRLRRIEIIRNLRLGVFDVLVGVNLLREGLDIPECGLVAILDADKEGFLRSGNGADSDHRKGGAQYRQQGDSLWRQSHTFDGGGTQRNRAPTQDSRRTIIHNMALPPTSIQKSIRDVMQSVYEHDHYTVDVNKDSSIPEFTGGRPEKRILKRCVPVCLHSAADLEFEEAAKLRDILDKLQNTDTAPKTKRKEQTLGRSDKLVQ